MAKQVSERTFHKFPSLPLEIRLMIWKAALPEPRIVDIWRRPLAITAGEWLEKENEEQFPKDGLRPSSLEESLADEYAEPMLGISSDTQPPSILFASRESYGVASKRYRREFRMAGSFPETYFDFRRDVLYLRYDTMEYNGQKYGENPLLDVLRCLVGMADSQLLSKVENLALLVDSAVLDEKAD
jgi:hypothetical protein